MIISVYLYNLKPRYNGFTSIIKVVFYEILA